MKYEYRPKGVCSSLLTFEINDNVVESLITENGCGGNLSGIGRLVAGKNLDEIIALLEGTPCGTRGTSCPDQIALALKEYKLQNL